MRNIGLSLPGFTTAQHNDLVARFGPAGTEQMNSIRHGVIIRDLTTGKVMVFNGTDFVLGIDL